MSISYLNPKNHLIRGILDGQRRNFCRPVRRLRIFWET